MSLHDDFYRDFVQPYPEQWAYESPFLEEALEEERVPVVDPWYEAHTPFMEQQKGPVKKTAGQRATVDPSWGPAWAPGGVYDQLSILREYEGLPLEFYRRPEIRALPYSERIRLSFQRKLAAIAKLGDLRDERAVSTLVELVEDRLFVAPKGFEPLQKLLLQQEAV